MKQRSGITFSHKGFTLIEFVVIITIFSIMAGVGLFNFRGFQTDVGVNNLAHDIAVHIKKVQTESGAALSNDDIFSTSQDVDPLWLGIVFPYDNGQFLSQYSVFTDVDVDGIYTENYDLLVDTIEVPSEDFISKVEYQTGQDQWSEYSNAALSFSFRRPFPEVGAWSIAGENVSRVRIVISSRDENRSRAVVVSKIGAISVESMEE